MCQINPTVGALERNRSLMVEGVCSGSKRGAAVMLFPELALSGYPPEDLILKRHFIEDCWQQLQSMAVQLPAETLTILGVPQMIDGRVFNAAAVLLGGRIIAVYQKMILPNYGVFDEKRVFSAGRIPLVLQAGGLRIGLHICEDSWYVDQDAVQLMRDAHLDVLLNLSASPYHRGKREVREETLGRTARYLNCALAYCNMVGGQDELVFDGGSLMLDARGEVTARARQFEEDLLLTELNSAATAPFIDEPTPPLRRIVHLPPLQAARTAQSVRVSGVTELMDDLAQVYAALKTGLRDYVEKNGFRKTVVALSGGIDSALVAAIAVDTLGADRVAGVTMPSQYTSDETLTDAGQLAANLGIELHTIAIKPIFNAFLAELLPIWEGQPPDVTEENLQARIRGNLIMALSNKFGWIVLTTGNKSELATGYCTLYGDMVGGFSLIKDVPKTLVFALARWRNERDSTPVIPPSTIARPPSAELRPNQMDTDSLPPYDILDGIIERYVEQDMGVDAIVAEGYDPETVKRVSRLIDLSEYKRRQGAPGIKITPKAFGRDRRMPITNAYREHVKGAQPV
jgi:NAD+ synthase (glutamine-hydrolysing)